MMRFPALPLALASVVVVSIAHASINIKPGLWEIKTTLLPKKYQICFTQELLDREDPLGQKKEIGHCTHTIKAQSPTKSVLDFNCHDGMTGTSEWQIIDPEHYKGKVIFANAKRPKTEIDHEGKFVSSDCGSVMPAETAETRK